MTIKIIRKYLTDTCTIGELYIDGIFFAYTLEDTYRNLQGDCSKKVQNKTAIEYGTYEVVATESARFKKKLPLILNVPCFSGIRMHGGNTSADTEGCILVGAHTDYHTKIWECAGKVLELTAMIDQVGKVKIEIVPAAVAV